MPRDKRKVEAALRAKGFEPKEGDHHLFVYRTMAGLLTDIRTKTSHTQKMKSLDSSILLQMARQCHLQNSDFLKLVDCPMNQAQYELALRERDPDLLR